MAVTRTPNAFDWTLVRSFLAVLDAGSLMGAARKLGAQQPTLSRHGAELEAQLGAPLFERTGRGVLPTAAALAIADAARQMELGADTLARTLTRQRETTSGTVRITTSEVAANYLLPPVLAQLQLAEPGIQIELVGSNQFSNLLRREADIAVRMARPAQSSLVARKLADIPIVACAHSSYLQRAGTPRVPADLLQHRLIGYDRDDTIERGFADMGMPLPRQSFVLRTDNQLAYGRLVAAWWPRVPAWVLWRPTTCRIGLVCRPCCPCCRYRRCRAGWRCTAKFAAARWCGGCTTSWRKSSRANWRQTD